MPICTYALISGFAKNPAYEVHVIVSGQGEFSERLIRENIRCQIIPLKRLRSIRFFKEFLEFIIGWIIVSIQIRRYIAKNKIAVVHFSDLIDAPFYPAAKLGGARVVAHLRMCLDNPARRTVFAAAMNMLTDKVICISKAVKCFSKLSDKKAVIVLDPGPDYSLFNPAKYFASAHNKIKVIAIAKFVEAKGHEYFVKMAELLEVASPGTFECIIIGGKEKGHEQYYDKVLESAEKSGVLRSLKILGLLPHEKIPEILSDADIFVHLPRCQEGLGGVILEAMAMGLPVVAFDSGGVRECFRDTVDGFLIKQFAVDLVAKSVLRLAEDAELRKKMGTAASEHVKKVFSISGHLMAVEKVYNSLRQ